MENRPTYYKIYKIMKLFEDGKYGTKEIISKSIKDGKYKKLTDQEDIVFDYLFFKKYIEKNSKGNYIFTHEGKMFWNNIKELPYRLECYSKDYPTILGGIIGGIIGSLFTIIVGIILG